MADERDPLRLRDVDIRPRLALLGHGQGSPAVFRDKDYLHPINATQMAEMTNMTQNYGH